MDFQQLSSVGKNYIYKAYHKHRYKNEKLEKVLISKRILFKKIAWNSAWKR